jgi:hypothetical protein
MLNEPSAQNKQPRATVQNVGRMVRQLLIKGQRDVPEESSYFIGRW